MLDYGCGRGIDADTYKLEKWDPWFFPGMPKGKFDTIMCNYVLNVISPGQEDIALWKIKNLLKPNGCAYITVRRDIKRDYSTSKGTIQRRVYLGLGIARETSSYCIYFLPGRLFLLPEGKETVNTVNTKRKVKK